jgi:sialate O-acetylesterase
VRMPAALAAAVLLCVASSGEVKLPSLLSDHMVVQRDTPIHFWGWAGPGEQVTVTFHGQTKAAAADPLGHWHVYLSPAAAGGPFEATVAGANTIVLHDVLVGDVWLASGQSNMEFAVHQLAPDEAKGVLAHADLPNIRLIRFEHAQSQWPLEDSQNTGWAASTAENAKDFSAVAFYFAQELSEREKVPVGVIESSWGGTSIEAWTSLQAMGSDAALAPIIALRGRRMERETDAQTLRRQEQAAAAAARAKGRPEPPGTWRPLPPMWGTGDLFNAMIAPLTPFAIRGVIWYQGEANTPRRGSRLDGEPELYGRQLETMIRDWRSRWGQGNLPFFYVQLASFKSDATEEDWAVVREGQRQALALRNTGMAVTIDIGNPDDVHPLDKKDVAARLALIARDMVFDEPVEFSGPLSREVTRDGNGLRVWFAYTKGMEARGGEPKSFELAGADGKFQPARARIEGSTVYVESSTVKQPMAVRYGWANDPDCNIFNGAGLPASPFEMRVPPMH